MDEFLEYSIMKSPVSIEGSTMHIFLYVEDVDALVAQAIDAGAKELMPVEDHSEGSRDCFLAIYLFLYFRGDGQKHPYRKSFFRISCIKDSPIIHIKCIER